LNRRISLWPDPSEYRVFQRLAISHQAGFAGWRVDRGGDTGNIAMALGNQIIHRLKRRILLFEKRIYRGPETRRG
jgi:hypothetical protein